MVAQNSPVSLTKNNLKKIQDMQFSLSDLERWIEDTMNQGLARLPMLDWSYWEQAATRMVDSKAPGLAARIREIGKLVEKTENWTEDILKRLGELLLLVRAFQRFEELPSDHQEELCNQAGFVRRKKELLNQNGLMDDWIVLGKNVEMEDMLFTRRTWLQGRTSKKYAILVDHHYGAPDFETDYTEGERFSGEVIFYPGLYPLRALLKARNERSTQPFSLRTVRTWEAYLDLRARVLAKNPWLDLSPALLEGIRPVWHNRKLGLMDEENRLIYPKLNNEQVWRIISVSAGKPLSLFGEWSREGFNPISILEPKTGIMPL